MPNAMHAPSVWSIMHSFDWHLSLCKSCPLFKDLLPVILNLIRTLVLFTDEVSFSKLERLTSVLSLLSQLEGSDLQDAIRHCKYKSTVDCHFPKRFSFNS